MTIVSLIVGILSIAALALSFHLDNWALLITATILGMAGVPLGVLCLKQGKRLGLIFSLITLSIFLFLFVFVFFIP